MINKANKNQIRKNRHLRVRNKVSGTAEAPRLAVYRSLNAIYAQIIDDTKGVTLVSASTMQDDIENKANVETCKQIGKLIADKAIKAGIKSVVFDRSGYLYHGRVKALAEAARENGLEF